MAQRGNYDFEIGFFEDLHKRMPKDIRTASILAHLYTETGRIDEGLKIDRKLVRLMPEDPVAHYNLACSLALKERLADAVQALRRAVELGYKDYAWMRKDPDLRWLQEDPKFIEFLQELGIG
ncbi:TPR end-of-group domain-containing protein [Coraliomargarita akajimensis]|uniref:TPR repeat-containing protein n=1 Tax=Coraliomargarita akajimensis (strain DSM 45221 / IAM 15411 / JCM 23193 / KCTC 12865 / 04OKA010-24) TaxID=583355 RepID=D5EIP2_CORAD|nr:hypothetical protein [Coraliomargarita akajimensis]ADE54291.1 TPR repeat-containing protein [Coraliomargarita akajimensis DSM 45221]